MRWRAFFFLNPNAKHDQKDNYGFNTRNTPPTIPQLVNFERKMKALISNIRFRRYKCQFQRQMQKDIRQHIKLSRQLLVPADKTTNYYKMKTRDYQSLLQTALTKDYKKAGEDKLLEVIKDERELANSLDIADRVTKMTKKEAFVTLKDHKQNFVNKPSCRLINPSKSELGKVSKKILDRINTAIINSTNANLWKNTAEVITWFNNIRNKPANSFIVFDIIDFYTSISAELMNKALDYASNFIDISKQDRDVIYKTKKAILISSNEVWQKKNDNSFTVTMGSYDGAECCERVGLYLISQITSKLKGNFGLYRDDGLCA